MKVSALVMAAWASLFCGCGRQEAAPYELVMRASSDPGRALAGVAFLYNDRPIGVTKADGSIGLAIDGREGEVFTLSVQCPEGYRAPAAPLEVTLRRGDDRAKRPEYGVTCAPKSRSVVVAIRAEQGADLPVRYLGREIARTDASGAAHVQLDVAPDDQFQLTLDTSAPASARLRPRSPAMQFAVHDQDDIFTFDQRFVAEPEVRRVALPSSRPTPLR